jgi:hypothetical protein
MVLLLAFAAAAAAAVQAPKGSPPDVWLQLSELCGISAQHTMPGSGAHSSQASAAAGHQC